MYRIQDAIIWQEINELLRLGFTEPCDRSAYASPIAVVQKRGIDQRRLSFLDIQCQKIGREPIRETWVKFWMCKNAQQRNNSEAWLN